ncbi:hypothetical protein [Silvibacterium acidisoli]|uniref:hypothetical protein n=1 Tax=Acidobacteriaceae bacterium ZG23-2 TaxID=2883246 RepID=UPI00406CE62A
MAKIGAALFLCAAATAAAYAQTSTPLQPKHYRMVFVVSNAAESESPQTLTLDVPVSSERRGMAQTSMSSMLTEKPDSAAQETLQCTDVQESSTGLSARVAFSADSTSQARLVSGEPIHSNLVFNKLIDVKLNTPTVITEPMRRMSLHQGVAVPGKDESPAPQITVTVTEI